MGGWMQPQGHVQVVSNMIDFDMDPQRALDASRVLITDGTHSGRVFVEGESTTIHSRNDNR
jgi:gamma-glutamyltranspeptidase/glutathione hydrolase